jgi:tetratricopeptide (TPR) repeat protein
MDPMRAMLEIRRPLDAKYPTSKPCDGWESKALNPVPTYTVTSHQLILRCADNRDHVITYTQLRKLKLFRISHAKKPANNIAHLVVEAPRFTFSLYFQDLAEARTVANAFYSLAHSTLSVRETDAAFQARVESARISGDRAEVWRRAQVRVETLLAGNRLSEAALLYRDALAVSPDWAQGHYNLALVYGSLQFYPEAITEMRRYLKLEANAPDARAAQDQIYGWEALLSPSQAKESGVQ